MTAFIVGESLLDIVVDGDSRREHAGGSPMNVAIGLGRLGVATVLRTQIGPDSDGRVIRQHIADASVSIDPASYQPTPTSTAVATLRSDRHADYEFSVKWDPGPIGCPDEARLIHTGSIASILAPGADEIMTLFRRAHDDVLLSFDPNIRPSMHADRVDVTTRVQALSQLAHIVKLSDEDAGWLHPELALDDVISHYLFLGASLVAITLGRRGCIIATSQHKLSLSAPPVGVIDTVGAGDAFMSGLLFAVLVNGLDENVRAQRLSSFNLEVIAKSALRSAQVTVSRAGANPPFLADLAS